MAGRGRKSPQNNMGLPAIPVPYGWIRVPRSGRRQTLIYIWSLPLTRWGPVSHSPPEFCLSLLSENLWRCRRQQPERRKRSKRGEERAARALVRLFSLSLPLCFSFSSPHQISLRVLVPRHHPTGRPSAREEPLFQFNAPNFAAESRS